MRSLTCACPCHASLYLVRPRKAASRFLALTISIPCGHQGQDSGLHCALFVCSSGFPILRLIVHMAIAPTLTTMRNQKLASTIGYGMNLFLGFALPALSSSKIEVSLDPYCYELNRTFEGPNGYPNGMCTTLQSMGNYSSFKVASLDEGCTGKQSLCS